LFEIGHGKYLQLVLSNVRVHPTEGRREAPLPTVGCNAWLGGVVTALENFESKKRVENVCFECSTSLRNATVAKRRKA